MLTSPDASICLIFLLASEIMKIVKSFAFPQG